MESSISNVTFLLPTLLNIEPVVIGAFDLGDLDVKLPGGGVGGVEHEGQGGGVGGVKIDCRWSGGESETLNTCL